MSLKVSETAADVINEMIVEAELSEGAGLRITVEGDEELSLNIEPEAQEGDTTTSDRGVTVFLDSAAADALNDKVLDAERHGDHAHFSIEIQQG